LTGDYDISNAIVQDCFNHAVYPEDKAALLRLRARNHWFRNSYSLALTDTLTALRLLGVEVNAAPTAQEAASMFEHVKNEILSVGFDEILRIPRTADSRIELAVALLNDAGMLTIHPTMPKP
jgi:hypothetical protein